MSYINHYCYRSPIRTFLALTKEEWLALMKTRHRQTTNHALEESNIKAWGNCFDVLQAAFRTLPENYHRLQIIFEYVLPRFSPDGPRAENDPGVRADVIILGKKDIVVLEFKQRDEYLPMFRRQALKYRHRLQKWHVRSTGMSKKTILVLTKGHDINFHDYKLEICSPEHLAAVLQNLLGPAPARKTKDEIRDWICSEYRRKIH